MEEFMEISVFSGWNAVGGSPFISKKIPLGARLLWWSDEVEMPRDGRVTILVIGGGKRFVRNHQFDGLKPEPGERFDYIIETAGLFSE